MRCATRGPVAILTYDPSFRGFWLADYIPQLVALDEAQMPRMTEYEEWLGPVGVARVPIPHDCADGFLSAYWGRPAAYLGPRIRAALSSFWAVCDVSNALGRLEADLKSRAVRLARPLRKTRGTVATVLVADDALAVRLLLAAVLEMEGHAVHQAPDGEEALALVRTLRPDLLLLDWHLPGRSGRDVLHAVRADPALTGVRVVVATGDPERLEQALAEGADGALPKPVGVDALRGEIGRVLAPA